MQFENHFIKKQRLSERQKKILKFKHNYRTISKLCEKFQNFKKELKEFGIIDKTKKEFINIFLQVINSLPKDSMCFLEKHFFLKKEILDLFMTPSTFYYQLNHLINYFLKCDFMISLGIKEIDGIIQIENDLIN